MICLIGSQEYCMIFVCDGFTFGALQQLYFAMPGDSSWDVQLLCALLEAAPILQEITRPPKAHEMCFEARLTIT